MSKRISELNQLQNIDDPTKVETIVVKDGVNYRMPVAAIIDEVTADSIGLGQVDNTADSEKPVSGPQRQALDGKADADHVHQAQNIQGLEDAIEDKVAELLTGTEGFVLSGQVQW